MKLRIVVACMTLAAGGACTSQGTSDGSATADRSTPETAATAPVAGPAVNVDIAEFAYSPSNVEIAAGTTVKWTNGDTVRHTVTTGDFSGAENVPDGTLDEELDAKGASISFTFDRPGTYSYYCRQHNTMNATVTVTK